MNHPLPQDHSNKKSWGQTPSAMPSFAQKRVLVVDASDALLHGNKTTGGMCVGALGDPIEAKYIPYPHPHPPQLTPYLQVNNESSTRHLPVPSTNINDKRMTG